MSLADELRKLVERIRNDELYANEIADELSVLLSKHAVAETSLKEFLETESGKMMLLSLKTIGVEFFCDQAGPGWRLLPQHAAEQPKLTLTEEQVRLVDKMSEDLGMELFNKGDKVGWAACDEFGHRIRALLTSPVAPPPQKIDHCPTCKSEQKGDTKNLVGHFPCLDLWHTTPHNSTKNPRLPYCKTENCWSWKMTGSEYCALHRPPVAPGEQPRRSEYEQCHSDDKFCEKCGIVHTDKFPCHAPPAQERASDDLEED